MDTDHMESWQHMLERKELAASPWKPGHEQAKEDYLNILLANPDPRLQDEDPHPSSDK